MSVDNIMLPRYECHKKVWALKIAFIEFAEDGSAKIAPVDGRYDIFVTKPLYRSLFKSELHGDDLGYWIQYEDNYQSWSPSKAFEEGYSLIKGN